MQLHAVRGRAVALICGRPNSKNSRLGFELLPFSTRREGPRRPLVTRREEWNANSSPRLNKTGSEAGAACLYCLRSCNTDDEWPPEGSEVHIQCHRNISARTGARRAFAAAQSAVLHQPHKPPRSASPTRAHPLPPPRPPRARSQTFPSPPRARRLAAPRFVAPARARAPVPRLAAARPLATESEVVEVREDGVVVPELVETLEWVLDSPPPLHQFEESPIIVEIAGIEPAASR